MGYSMGKDIKLAAFTCSIRVCIARMNISQRASTKAYTVLMVSRG